MKTFRCAALLLLPLLAFSAHAQNRFVLGTHYKEVTPAQPTSAGDRIEVVEMFWYGCSHCADFEPYVERWLESKPDDVVFVRMPAVFSSSQEAHARAYFTAETLGVLDKTHRQIFRAIHSENQPLNTEGTLADFFARNGVSNQEFRKTFLSIGVNGVDGRVNHARQLSRSYGITGTPSMVINGKYWTSGALAGSYDELLKLVDELVAKEREHGRASTTSH